MTPAMPIFYPLQRFGRFGLGMGLTARLLHDRFGLDVGERYHHDIIHRVEAVREVDRLVWDAFRGIGLGFEEPFPRATIEPFGHRFVPVLFGCEPEYAHDEEPAVRTMTLDTGSIASRPPWTPERLASLEPVKEIVAQAKAVRARYGDVGAEARRRMGYNPHERPLSSLQNLGSVINTAVSVFGQDVLCLYADDPDALRSFYRGVTDLMLLCLRTFPELDGEALSTVFVGDCTVAMIGPADYARCNESFDRELAEFARSLGARFLVHQDSGATPHLEGYARLGRVHGLDVGQDTDFAAAARRFPAAAANCILFPSWIRATPADGIREELLRLMRTGLAFADFTFSIFEVDPGLAEGKIFEFYDLFRACAQKVGLEARG
jgi:hypothetical protein